MQVLVIDDSKAVRSILAKMLRELEFDVVEAANGQDALERLREIGSVDLAIGVSIGPADAFFPGRGRDGDGPAEAGLFRQGAGVDEDAVFQGLGAGVGGDDLAEELGQGVGLG